MRAFVTLPQILRPRLVAVIAIVLAIPASADATISLSAPTGRQIYQRDAANLSNVVVAGTYTGSVDRIEARAVTRAGYGGTNTDWVTLDASPTGGTFSSTLPVHGGWYDLEVRTVTGTVQQDLAAVERVGVGEVFITAGQSNSSNHGNPVQVPDDDRVSVYNMASHTWQFATDPQPNAAGTGGSAWPQTGDLLAAKYDVPIGIVAVGWSGSYVADWLPGGPLYGRIQNAIGQLSDTGFRAILWHQGEMDSAMGTSSATYTSQLNSIIAQSRTDAGFSVPWGVSIVTWYSYDTDANRAEIAAAQHAVIDGTPDVFLGAQTDLFPRPEYVWDGIHFNQLGLDAAGQQWADAIDAAHIITPEPSAFVLVVTGLVGLAAYAWHKRK